MAEVIEALEETRGLITFAAARLGCSRATIHNYAARYPTVKDTIHWQRREITDAAMAQLWDAVERGEPWAILYTLRTFGGPEWAETPKSSGPLVIETVAAREVVFRVVRPDEVDDLDEVESLNGSGSVYPPVRSLDG